MHNAARQRDYSLLCAAAVAAKSGGETITHLILISFLRTHCLQPRGQTKRTVPDSTRTSNFIIFFKKREREIEINVQLNKFSTRKQAFSSFVCFTTSACQSDRCDQFPQD